MDEIIIKLIEVSWPYVVGAILAIGGGWISDMIRAGGERKRELREIKVTIGDELGEIKSIIQDMHTVWEQANHIPIKCVTDLLGNTTAFDNLRIRLYLITDDALRKQIKTFYKKLKDIAEDSKGKVGSLSDTDTSKAEQESINTKFQGLCAEAKTIIEKLVKPD